MGGGGGGGFCFLAMGCKKFRSQCFPGKFRQVMPFFDELCDVQDL